MKVTCISDLHGEFPLLEGGNLLIVAGDLTGNDTLEQHSDFLNWICKQDYECKVVVAGNHDGFLQKNPKFFSKSPIKYLCDSGAEFRLYPKIGKMEEGKCYEAPKFKIWGSPWTRKFPGMNPNCRAFTLDNDTFLSEKFCNIPEDTDILVCHSPMFGILDEVKKYKKQKIENTGSAFLRDKVEAIKPLLFVCGHIHEQYGKCTLKPQMDLSAKNTICINASIMNEVYDPVNKPVTVFL